VPVIIVSSGMAPFIRAVLSKHIGDEEASEIEIISNDVEIQPNGKWQIKYRHPSSEHGHDKSRAILPYRELPNPPSLFFFGDGVSDISAAKHADILFVKQKADGENDLATYCTRRGIRHILFTDFSKALPVVQSVVKGDRGVDEALSIGEA